MDATLTELTGVAAHINNIIVTDSEEFLKCLNRILDQIQQYVFVSRLTNGNFFQTSIKYLWFIFDKNGHRLDPENIYAIIQYITALTYLTTVCSFLLLVSYCSALLSEMHQVHSSLNHLLTKVVPWNWTNKCQFAFDKIKVLLGSEFLLTHHNPSTHINVISYTSNYGIW